MKILNYLPLLIWSLGFFFYSSWGEHLERNDGVEEDKIKDGAEAGAKIYFGGLVFWFFLGLFLSV